MNPVVHFEIPTEDVESAKKFYADVFGWQFMNLPGVDYTFVQTAESDENGMSRTPGTINGGMYKPPHPEPATMVISVPDIDAHLAKIQAAGGKVVVPRQPVADMGAYARFEDPSGNLIGLWENAASSP